MGCQTASLFYKKISQYTLNYILYLGVPLRVGLSAISFSAALQKDAAPIPNAEGLLKTNFQFSNFNFQFP